MGSLEHLLLSSLIARGMHSNVGECVFLFEIVTMVSTKYIINSCIGVLGWLSLLCSPIAMVTLFLQVNVS